VLAALERWKVAVDDSGGDALADTPAGLFARLAAEVALGGLAPVSLLAVLKHPLTRLGAPAGAHAGTIAALEKAVLRGPRPRPGTVGLAHALAVFHAELAKLRRRETSDLHPSDPRANLSEAQLNAAAALVDRLRAALAPLEGLACAPFAKVAALHRDVITALSADETGAPAAFHGNDGVALERAFEEIALYASNAEFAVEAKDYADLFRTVISDRMVRRPGLPGVRLHIYGLLEARLQSVDRVVLGGLVEGTWPPDMTADPWLSRPMRHALGLDLPERRISLSAHDFAQALGAPEVILAYPTKSGGAPGGSRKRTALERRVQTGSEICRLGALARSSRPDQAGRKARTEAAARRPADRALGDRYRELAA
jgi:ATP-dependent helicase/nuclease subunit B